MCRRSNSDDSDDAARECAPRGRKPTPLLLRLPALSYVSPSPSSVRSLRTPAKTSCRVSCCRSTTCSGLSMRMLLRHRPYAGGGGLGRAFSRSTSPLPSASVSVPTVRMPWLDWQIGRDGALKAVAGLLGLESGLCCLCKIGEERDV